MYGVYTELSLTLTLVVFEYNYLSINDSFVPCLTLTLVVFECETIAQRVKSLRSLTLTLVVFEFLCKVDSLGICLVFNLNIGCI